MSTNDLKYMVNKLDTLVTTRNPESPVEDYIDEKEKLLTQIIQMASTMKMYNANFPDRFKEDFQEREDLAKSTSASAG